MTTTSTLPKVLLFDIGGVCVNSPFQAILDYEKSLQIPPGWVNFSISRTKPNGAWHKLERGEVDLDAAFFKAFEADLSRADLWKEFLQLQLQRRRRRSSSSSSSAASIDSSTNIPPLPKIDVEWMYWEMMRISREPDAYMFPALKKLRQSGKFMIAALSNTSIFPPGHPYNEPPADPEMDVKAQFEVFVSSAHVGLRKPDPKIYQLALELMQEAWSGPGQLQASDILFLDDIGENLKTAKQLGFRTLKVNLGNTRQAVRELQSITGLSLLDDEAKL